jgi:hypothetical protein
MLTIIGIREETLADLDTRQTKWYICSKCTEFGRTTAKLLCLGVTQIRKIAQGHCSSEEIASLNNKASNAISTHAPATVAHPAKPPSGNSNGEPPFRTISGGSSSLIVVAVSGLSIVSELSDKSKNVKEGVLSRWT